MRFFNGQIQIFWESAGGGDFAPGFEPVKCATIEPPASPWCKCYGTFLMNSHVGLLEVVAVSETISNPYQQITNSASNVCIRVGLKGQCHEIFNHFLFGQRETLLGLHINKQKWVRKEIREKRVYVFYVYIVTNYADSVWCKLDNADTCRLSCWLCGHANDCADTNDKLWRLLKDFKGIIRQKLYLGVFTYPIVIIQKYENGGYILLNIKILTTRTKEF